eukprot:scaffold291507_cov56-Attheya_sp.AAC.3
MSLVVYRTASVSGEDHSKLLVGRFLGSTLVRMSAVNWKGTLATKHSMYICVTVCGSGKVVHMVVVSLTRVSLNISVYAP